LGYSTETVCRYRRQGDWKAYSKPSRNGFLDGQCEWIKERLLDHNGNAEVVRQGLSPEKGIAVSLRTVERAVEPWWQELRAAALATMRYEAPPGKQLQADVGETYARIANERARWARYRDVSSDNADAISVP
jgi:hypothetical protein